MKKLSSNHSDRAFELFNSGYNCAQSAFGAFCEDLGMDLKTGLCLSSSFGGGMGRMREVCGAMSGIFMAAGLIYGYSENDNDEKKTLHYKRIQYLAGEFKKETGTIICRELLELDENNVTYVPEKRTTSYYEKRPCGELVRLAAKILDDYIRENEPVNL